MIVEGIYELKK